MPPQQNDSYLMATPRPPQPQHVSPQGSPGPPPPPKVHGTQYVWADGRTNTSVAPGSARMTSSQLPVDATQGGIVPMTTRGVRLSMQQEQQAQDIANSGRSQVAPLPVITADNLPAAWNTQKPPPAVLPGAGVYDEADVPDGMQYPAAPKKPGKRKKGKRGADDDGGGVIPPQGAGSSPFSFGGPPGGGISSTGGVIPPSSPLRFGGTSFGGNEWDQGLRPGPTNKSGAATPSHASQSGMSMSVNLPLIEIVPPESMASHNELLQSAKSLSQPLTVGNPWTQKFLPTPLPPAVPFTPGRSKGAGGLGTGGWGPPAPPSDMGGGISSLGGVIPTAGAPVANKKKKKREGAGGWGGP